MGFLMAFLSAVFYAANSVVVKRGMRDSKSDNGIFISLCMNVMILAIILLIYRMVNFGNFSSPTIFGILVFALAGFLTTFLGRSLLFIGIRKIGSSRAAGIKNSSPIFTVFFAILILNEMIVGLPWVGMFFIFAGLILQAYILFNQEKSEASRIGYFITLGSALSFGIGQGVRKQALLYFPDPVAGAFIGALVGLIIYLVIETYKKTLTETVKHNVTSINKYYVIGGVFTSFALLTFFIAIHFIHVAYVGAILAIEPILTIVMGKFLLKSDENITTPIFVCAVLIFIGAGIISLTG